VTIFPLIFSAIFFAVPGVRLLSRRRRLRRRERRQLRRELLREIWARPDEAHDPARLAERAAARAGQPVEAARASLEKLLVELDGDVDTDAAGELRYRFSRLAAERKAVASARAGAAVRPLGRIVFASDDERPAR
jgi:hypothetical protein